MLDKPESELRELATRGQLGPYPSAIASIQAVLAGERLICYVESGECTGGISEEEALAFVRSHPELETLTLSEKMNKKKFLKFVEALEHPDPDHPSFAFNEELEDMLNDMKFNPELLEEFVTSESKNTFIFRQENKPAALCRIKDIEFFRGKPGFEYIHGMILDYRPEDIAFICLDFQMNNQINNLEKQFIKMRY